MIKFVEKYVPKEDEFEILIKAGLSYILIHQWRIGISKPNTLTVIYLCMAIAQEYGHDYNKIVIEALWSATK